MIPLTQRRPANITLFALFFLGAALVSFMSGLLNIPGQQRLLQVYVADVPWSRDAAIVWLSAWLSIALIPIGMVWLSAVRFARWMVTVMAAPKLFFVAIMATKGLKMIAALPFATASALLTMLAVAMLFTPASNRWFARKVEDDSVVFE